VSAGDLSQAQPAAQIMPGKVYLVGAGPGDPGLLTLKGKDILERADCIIYDFLANAELLRFTRPDSEKICVGKHGGQHKISQEEINRLLVSRAREGRSVCRLKGGDPYVFGRGAEEVQELVKARIPYEVVPGVSSGHAVPAYAGIPVTHREFASSVTFVTGHEDPTQESDLDWPHLATSRGSLVFFMGVKRLAQITARLIANGGELQTPAAVIRWGSWPQQQVVVGTLENIGSRAATIAPPAIIVVGEVVKLRDRLNWFEKLPLFGKRIAITRTREQAKDLRDQLAALGALVIEIPTIEIRNPASWEPLDDAIRRLEDFDYLLVTSVNGVRNFLARLRACGRDVRDLKGLKVGAIGPATAGEFAKTGIKVDLMPDEYRAEGLLESLGKDDLHGKAFLIPRAKVARDLVPKVLTQKGARVEVVEAYETAVPERSAEELHKLLKPLPDVITFTSSSTAVNFSRLIGETNVARTLKGVAIASIGPITSDTIRKLSLSVTIEAKTSTVSGLVTAIREYFNKNAH
jgi:uroporphyrinogen III methyltransferase/synthase